MPGDRQDRGAAAAAAESLWRSRGQGGSLPEAGPLKTKKTNLTASKRTAHQEAAETQRTKTAARNITDE